jgi:hypothetical protein
MFPEMPLHNPCEDSPSVRYSSPFGSWILSSRCRHLKTAPEPFKRPGLRPAEVESGVKTDDDGSGILQSFFAALPAPPDVWRLLLRGWSQAALRTDLDPVAVVADHPRPDSLTAEINGFDPEPNVIAREHLWLGQSPLSERKRRQGNDDQRRHPKQDQSVHDYLSFSQCKRRLRF